MPFEDKPSAMLGAFINRFAIGFVIGASNLAMTGWASGLLFWVLLSLPDAIITKSWLPILVMGTVGGAVIGWLVGAGEVAMSGANGPVKS